MQAGVRTEILRGVEWGWELFEDGPPLSISHWSWRVESMCLHPANAGELTSMTKRGDTIHIQPLETTCSQRGGPAYKAIMVHFRWWTT